MTWSNLALWMVQIAALAAAAAALAAIFRLRPAGTRLSYWQAVLALCLLLPAVQPWRREMVVLPSEPAVAAVAVDRAAVPVVPTPRGRSLTWTDAAAAVLAAGVLLRLSWFALGLFRLRQYRRAATILHPMPAPVAAACRRVGVYPEIALSNEVSGPVTFGFRDPVVLLPAQFLDLEPEVQTAVTSHELLHVRRRDWLFTAIEELTRAVFWFHPAIWWTLGQIQLAREQSVDRAVVKLSQNREQYVDALLALSGARSQLDLAPAPLFLRRRHLTARVAAILKEAEMSKRRLWGTLAACAGGLVIAGWLVCARLPLEAAPQYVTDAPGVTVKGADAMLHRNAVLYPFEAREKQIEGTLVLDVVVGSDGNVTEATVLSGPEELRASTLKSVRGWHFRPAAVGRQQVMVEFKAAPAGGVVGGVPGGVVGGVVGGVPRGMVMEEASTEQLDTPRPLERVFVRGLSKAAESDLTARIKLQPGQIVDNNILEQVRKIVREFDAGLIVSPALFGKREDSGTVPAPKLAISIYPGHTGVKPEHALPPGEAARDLSSVPHKLTRIEITGLSPEAAGELRSRLPVHEGDMETRESIERLQEVVKAFDPNLAISMMARAPKAADGKLPELIEMGIQIRPKGMQPSGMALMNVKRRLDHIDIQGLPPDAAEELRRRLPVKDGQVLETDDFRRIDEAVKAFDPHLSASQISAGLPRRLGPDGKVIPPDSMNLTIHIRPVDVAQALEQHAQVSRPAEFPAAAGVQRIRVGGNVQQAKLKYQVRPEYPEEAKAARIQGVVRLGALIGADGSVKNMAVVSGHPLLVPAAMEAVKQWRYEQTFLNGAACEVVTQVDVNFTISQ